ncbi:inositol monophosphatase [Fusarium sporotrichioides]|uniref:Inositol monophosphatase n=1 Tax=Fusarium sporotrichioides TaxID=5514 RepID=A0A395SWC1_FUSSP|nr:inositol monophosphatase [Fusarium sporotrichioides]
MARHPTRKCCTSTLAEITAGFTNCWEIAANTPKPQSHAGDKGGTERKKSLSFFLLESQQKDTVGTTGYHVTSKHPDVITSSLQLSPNSQDAKALVQAIAAGEIANINVERIEVYLRSARDMILEHHRPAPAKGKNDFGEAVTILDIVIQKYFARALRKDHSDHTLVGEEDTPGVCLSKFPSPISDDANIWLIDPVDGSKFLQVNSTNCSTILGYQKGLTPILGAACMIDNAKFIIGGKYWPVTINRQPVPAPAPCNEANIKIGYGLGKRKSQEVRDLFMDELKHITPEEKLVRLGHLTNSARALLEGQIDAYLSLKEEWYKCGAIYAILTKAGYVTNINPKTLNINDAFSAWFAKPDFAAKYLQPGSILAKCMEN